MLRYLAVVLALAAAAPPAAAAALPACEQRPPAYEDRSARVTQGITGGGATAERYWAVLPNGYAEEPERRYPVLYLLHGYGSTADEYLACMDLLGTMGDDDVIVVLPFGTPDGFWIDWHNGAQRRESALIGALVPHVDRRFRTIPDRSQRGIAGLSMGGYGAMVQAARHPELFGTAASFSGIVASSLATGAAAVPRWASISALAPGAFANPLTNSAWRAQHDPASLAARLRGTSLFLSSGNGVACDADEAARFAEPDPSQPTMEPLVRDDNRLLHAALVRAAAPHSYREYECGAHTFRTFQRGLGDAWPQLARALSF